MQNKKFIFACLLLLFQSTAASAEELYEMNGDRLGMTFKQFEEKYRGPGTPWCTGDYASLDENGFIFGLITCKQSGPDAANGGRKTTLEGIEVNISYQFLPDDNAKFKKLPDDLRELGNFQLVEIGAIFPQESLEVMKKAFIRKYGDNYKKESKEHRNQPEDEPFMIEYLIWKNETSAAAISDYIGKGKAFVQISHLGLYKKLEKRFEKLYEQNLPINREKSIHKNRK